MPRVHIKNDSRKKKIADFSVDFLGASKSILAKMILFHETPVNLKNITGDYEKS